MKIQVVCHFCKKEFMRERKSVNQNIRRKTNNYCSRLCVKKSQISKKTDEEKKQDQRRWSKNHRDRHKDSRNAYNRMYKEKNKQKILAHENKPETKLKRKEQQRRWYARKNYGDMWESQVLVLQIKELTKSLSAGNEDVQKINSKQS